MQLVVFKICEVNHLLLNPRRLPGNMYRRNRIGYVIVGVCAVWEELIFRGCCAWDETSPRNQRNSRPSSKRWQRQPQPSMMLIIRMTQMVTAHRGVVGRNPRERIHQ